MNSFQKQLLLWLKRAIKAAAFLLVFIFLLNTASVILTPKVNKREDGSSEAIHFGYRGEPKDSLDIVMVGNSDLYNSVIPIDLYQNFGIAGYAGGRPYESALGAWRQSRDILRYHRNGLPFSGREHIYLEVAQLEGALRIYACLSEFAAQIFRQ